MANSLHKKGNAQGMMMTIIVMAIVLGAGLTILSSLQSQAVTSVNGCNATSTISCNAAYNATGTVVTKLATVPTWIGIIITASMGFMVLGYFYARQ